MDNKELLSAIGETLRMLDNDETPEVITVDIKTEEDQKFWFNMCLHGYVAPVGKPKDE